LRNYNKSANQDSLRERGDFLLLSAGVPSGSVQYKTAPNPEPNIYLAELDEDEDEEDWMEDEDEVTYDEDEEDRVEDEDEESYVEDRVEEDRDEDEFEQDEYEDEDYPLAKGWRYSQSNMQTRSNRSATSRQNRLSPSTPPRSLSSFTPPRSLSSFQSAAPRLKLSKIYGDDDEVMGEKLDVADDVGERRRKKQKTESKRKRFGLRRMKKKRTDQYANLGRMSISKIRKVLSSKSLSRF
jgi:hypothetical protein